MLEINGAGLGFTGAAPNEEGQESGSTLKIDGTGFLEVKGGSYAAAMGAGYGYGYNNNALGQVSNIIINSGKIHCESGMHGAIIGPCLRGSSKNITINGGSISSTTLTAYKYGIIGSNVVINGGKIEINGGVESGSIIQGEKIEINGGTINAQSSINGVIKCSKSGGIEITGGNILARGKNLSIAAYEEGTSNLTAYNPNDRINNLYETKIKLQGVEKDKQITKLTTSDNINYGIKDMYTLEDGMLYLYLPLGTRTINVEVDGKTYTGTVETKETAEVVTLNKAN